MKIKLFVAREIQYLELGIFSFNSYIYYLARGFIASTRAFNLLTRDFNLPTRAFYLATRTFSILTCEFELLIRQFELVTCRFEFATREFELVTRGLELVARGFELITHSFELVTCVLLFHTCMSTTSDLIFRIFENLEICSTFFPAKSLPLFNVTECEVVSIATFFHSEATLKLGERRKFRKYAKLQYILLKVV